MTTLLTLTSSLAAFLIVIGLIYYAWGMVQGIHTLHRQGRHLRDQADLTYGHPLDPPPEGAWFTYFLVPALDEEVVIARTVTGLLGDGSRSHVVVIDDGSTDGTGTLAADAGGSQVTVVRRDLPDARQGKGRALNAGYRWLVADAARRGLEPADVVVCVMDADGRLSDGALREVLACFDEPDVGAVQLAVRIRNRDRYLTAYQDHAFFGVAAVGQFARMSTGSVSLGGNGQFSRLTALRDLGDDPWSDALTEDLDLGLRLNLRGWRTSASTGAAVDQQGLTDLGALLRQRTRWCQGHMAAGAAIPAIWRAEGLPNSRALELATYLLSPWVILPWSILFHVGVATFLWRLVTRIGLPTGLSPVLVLLFWYLGSFAIGYGNAALYRRRDRTAGVLRPVLMAHGVVTIDYLGFFVAWRAFARLVTGRTAWAKTGREVEVVGPVGAPGAGSTPAVVP